ncbi:MAG: sortase, partial [Patescibacteria group bacterium]
DLPVLDAALLKGVVHYPGSGNLNDVRNVFLFGHSTGFRVVQNEAFKVFNNLKELETNDLIRAQSATHEYVYRVITVELANAEEVEVDFRSNVRMLTLSTCNAFGAKEERYIVRAEFVGEFPL